MINRLKYLEKNNEIIIIFKLQLNKNKYYICHYYIMANTNNILNLKIQINNSNNEIKYLKNHLITLTNTCNNLQKQIYYLNQQLNTNNSNKIILDKNELEELRNKLK